MSDPITIMIPGAPHGKGRPRFRRNGGTYTPSHTRNYETAVGRITAKEMAGRDPITTPVHVELRAHFEIPKSWPAGKKTDALLGRVRPTGGYDIDNICKAVLDGMNKIAYRDDSLVVSIRASKVYSEQPFVVAMVKPIEGSEEPNQGEVA